MSADAPELLLIGYVQRVHGMRGELAVAPFNPDSERWSPGSRVLLLPADPEARHRRDNVVRERPLREVTITGIRRGGKGALLLQLAEISDRTEAEPLKATRVAVPLDTLEELAEGEFFLYEVGGWTVVDSDGEKVGTVVGAIQTHVEMLEIAPVAGGETFFVPVVRELITHIDRSAKRFVIADLEGLIP